MRPFFSPLLSVALFFLAVSPTLIAADKNVLLIAGPPSHGPGQHEHNAGVLLLQKCLTAVPGLRTQVALNGWPKDSTAFKNVDAVILFCDGGKKHIALAEDNLPALEKILSGGAGLGLLHYAVEPTIELGQQEFLRWIGGCFEIDWSVNPHWDAAFQSLPIHPVTRGVKPFTIRDEWYFNMRFVDGMKGVTPLLVATPDASTMRRKDGPHEGNPAARAAVARGDTQTVAWAFERPTGGRGFGFTGAHFHANWGNENFRKLALNAVLWLANMDVPAKGVASTVSPEDLLANLDPKPGPRPKSPAAK
ncbi:MAG: hypothetical protein RIQ93_1532 [Verrucomicrobiota bacterium]|jgi:hypothetical protein